MNMANIYTGTKKSEPTFLEKFINEKLNNYVEPQRKGTPRGEPIGFSKQKYQATLLLMADMKQQDIAELIGVSYGLLRRWRTEKKFLEMTKKHCNEYLEMAMAYFNDIDNSGSFIPEHAFNDYSSYGKMALGALSSWIMENKDKIDNDDPDTIRATLNFNKYILGRSRLKNPIQNKEIIEIMVGQIYKFINEKPLSGEDKEYISTRLEIIKNSLENL
jgi:hypothetical protein